MDKIRRLYQYIQHCEDEDCVSDELAVLIGGQREVKILVSGFRVVADVVKWPEAYEVKLDAEPYDGIGQALLYGLAGLRAHLVHVLSRRLYQFDNYVDVYKSLNLGFCTHVIAKDGRYWSQCM